MYKFLAAFLLILGLLPSGADAHERRQRGWHDPYRPHYGARPYDFMYPYGAQPPPRYYYAPALVPGRTIIYCDREQGNLVVDQYGNYVCVRYN